MTSAFNWRGQPSIFSKDRAFNGRNHALSKVATAARERKGSAPRDSINTETKVEAQGKRWRLAHAGI